MNNYLRLTKVMLKNESMPSPSIKSKKVLVGILGFLAVLFIFVPACILVGAISFIMTTAIKEAGGHEQGLAFILLFIAAFSIIFGLSVILNVFYFSNDMNYLLPFPLQPWEIIASKFTVAYINESVMEFLVILSAMIGFIVASGTTIMNVVVSIIAMITVPILPLVYCAIICIICMTFTGIIKNKDSVSKIMGFATVAIIAAAFAGVDMVGGLDIDNYATSLVEGNNVLYNILSSVFIHVKLICMAADGNILALIAYAIINIVGIMVFLFVAQKFYFKGVIGLGASGKTGSKDLDKLIKKNMKKRGVMFSYLMKEFKVLLRTPTFLMNCVMINLLWPVMLFAISKLQDNSGLFTRLYLNYMMGNEKMLVYVPIGVVIISILITAANSIASTSITREGTAYVFMKYIPLSIKKQLLIKSALSIIISQSFLTIYLVVAGIMLHISVWYILFYIVLSTTGVIFVTFLGITLDTVNPKLLWDDEINALRGNSTVFFAMAYAMFLGVLLIGIGFILLEITKLNVIAINGIILIFMLLLDIVAYINCVNTGYGNLEE